MLEKRKSPRSKMVLPVKVWIDKDTHLAHTIDGMGRLKVLWPCAIATALRFPRPPP